MHTAQRVMLVECLTGCVSHSSLERSRPGSSGCGVLSPITRVLCVHAVLRLSPGHAPSVCSSLCSCVCCCRLLTLCPWLSGALRMWSGALQRRFTRAADEVRVMLWSALQPISMPVIGMHAQLPALCWGVCPACECYRWLVPDGEVGRSQPHIVDDLSKFCTRVLSINFHMDEAV